MLSNSHKCIDPCTKYTDINQGLKKSFANLLLVVLIDLVLYDKHVTSLLQLMDTLSILRL